MGFLHLLPSVAHLREIKPSEQGFFPTLLTPLFFSCGGFPLFFQSHVASVDIMVRRIW